MDFRSGKGRIPEAQNRLLVKRSMSTGDPGKSFGQCQSALQANVEVLAPARSKGPFV